MVVKSRAAVILRWTLFLLADAGLVLLVWSAWMTQATGSFRPAARIGNTAAVAAALPAKGPDDPVRFAVISDIEEGVETFRAALRRFAEHPPDAVVINGDLCYRPTPEGYAYFLWQLRDAPWPGPYFCVAGNHDVADGGDLTLFRRHVGSERFAVRLGACQLLILDNSAGGLSEADYRWLESAAGASGPAPAIRHRFLFLHRPPLDAPKGEDRVQPSPAYGRLYDLAPRLRIRRVYAGHLHAYRRLEIGETAYVVCGGGGADRQSPEASPHYVEITVSGERMDERVVPLPEIHSPVEAMDRFACLYVGPWLRRHPVASVAIVLGVLALLAWQGGRVACRLGGRSRPSGAPRDALQSPPAT
jgi:hypothetical protein